MQPQYNEANETAIRRNKATARRMLEMFHSGNLEAVDEIASPDCFAAGPHPLAIVSWASHPLTTSLAAEREHLTAAIEAPRAAFENLRFDEETLIADPKKVFMKWRFSGTNTGPLGGREATGIDVTVFGADVMLLDEDGRIVEHIDFYTRPRLDLLYKLGHLDLEMLETLREQGLVSLPPR
jgi:hypothetical protein